VIFFLDLDAEHPRPRTDCPSWPQVHTTPVEREVDLAALAALADLSDQRQDVQP
jgi:hypothetical protein